ncbi:MAG: DUF2911 domain-containing protein [Bacteroidetes bacterium]|nr:DUF2911 domain-containing protein [Bacteroidota bacterium]
MKTLSTLLFFISLCTAIAIAQQPPSKLLRVSPYSSITQTIGITEVSVMFHRPGVKGREIWNKLVPYNQVWRAGANNATVFSFSDDVTINGTTLKAGKYSFFTIPAEKAWTVIFNSQADQWGAYYYDSTKNVFTFSVTPEQAPHEEWLSYSFSDLGLTAAKLSLRWEKVSVSFVINTNTAENVSKLEGSFKSQAAQQAALLARYSLDSKSDYENGLQAIDRAISLNPSWGNFSVKAQLYAAQEKFADAVKTGEQALETGKKSGANVSTFEPMVNEWKTKLPPVKGKKK